MQTNVTSRNSKSTAATTQTAVHLSCWMKVVVLLGGLAVAGAVTYRRPIAHRICLHDVRQAVSSRFRPVIGESHTDHLDHFAAFGKFCESVERAKPCQLSRIPQISEICLGSGLVVEGLKHVVLNEMQANRLWRDVRVASVAFDQGSSPQKSAHAWLCDAFGVPAMMQRTPLEDLLPSGCHNVIFIEDLECKMSAAKEQELFLLCDKVNLNGTTLTILVFN